MEGLRVRGSQCVWAGWAWAAGSPPSCPAGSDEPPVIIRWGVSSPGHPPDGCIRANSTRSLLSLREKGTHRVWGQRWHHPPLPPQHLQGPLSSTPAPRKAHTAHFPALTPRLPPPSPSSTPGPHHSLEQDVPPGQPQALLAQPAPLLLRLQLHQVHGARGACCHGDTTVASAWHCQTPPPRPRPQPSPLTPAAARCRPLPPAPPVP